MHTRAKLHEGVCGCLASHQGEGGCTVHVMRLWQVMAALVRSRPCPRTACQTRAPPAGGARGHAGTVARRGADVAGVPTWQAHLEGDGRHGARGSTCTWWTWQAAVRAVRALLLLMVRGHVCFLWLPRSVFV